jgi:hypothetical protein
MNKDMNQMQGGCGGRCACADASKKEEESCAPKGEIALDKDGKCPCGKSLDDCCHKDEIKSTGNDAVGELCEPHAGKNLC